MNARTRLLSTGLLASFIMGGAVSAQQAGSYQPPKLTKEGTAATPIAGPGSVTVKVRVGADGTPAVIGVISSTNHADDRAALEIAHTSTYRAAVKNGQPVLAYYDFKLTFTGSGALVEGTATAGSLASFEMMTRAGNYKGAQAGLQEYVGAHPDDARAELDLGIADTFLQQYDAAVSAFVKAGTIPQNDQAIAGKAYAEAAAAQYHAKAYDAGVADAQRAAELSPGFATYNTLGFGELSKGDYAAAIAALEKARTLASQAKAPDAQRAIIDDNLVSAYAAAGNVQAAKPVAAEAAALQPGNENAHISLANYYIKKAQGLADSGKYAEAGAVFEQGASEVPSQAAALYAQAAVAYLNARPNPINDRAKADADRALALDPDNALANYAAGVALANQPGRGKDALPYLQKADQSARKSGDTNLASAIEKAISQVSAGH